MVTKMRFGKQY